MKKREGKRTAKTILAVHNNRKQNKIQDVDSQDKYSELVNMFLICKYMPV